MRGLEQHARNAERGEPGRRVCVLCDRTSRFRDVLMIQNDLLSYGPMAANNWRQGATCRRKMIRKRQGGGHFARAAALSCPQASCLWGFFAASR
jgi:hypothetical protein